MDVNLRSCFTARRRTLLSRVDRPLHELNDNRTSGNDQYKRKKPNTFQFSRPLNSFFPNQVELIVMMQNHAEYLINCMNP
jgi:hypothetical protein